MLAIISVATEDVPSGCPPLARERNSLAYTSDVVGILNYPVGIMLANQAQKKRNQGWPDTSKVPIGGAHGTFPHDKHERQIKGEV